MDTYKHISVLSYSRRNNTAYVAESYRFTKSLDEVTLDDKWYNWSYPLDVIEEVLETKLKSDLIDKTFMINATKLSKLMKGRW